MTPIPQQLIENALALTGKTMEDMEVECEAEFDGYKFSIEKFCYYLLSPEFISAYMPLLFPFDTTLDYRGYLQYTATEFGEAIYEYQSGNEEQMTTLLSKI